MTGTERREKKQRQGQEPVRLHSHPPVINARVAVTSGGMRVTHTAKGQLIAVALGIPRLGNGWTRIRIKDKGIRDINGWGRRRNKGIEKE